MEVHRVVRRRGSHIFQTLVSQMAVTSALRSGHNLPLGRFVVLISVKGLSRPQGRSAAVRIRSIEKNPVT
jgi:hypothetical protein